MTDPCKEKQLSGNSRTSGQKHDFLKTFLKFLLSADIVATIRRIIERCVNLCYNHDPLDDECTSSESC